MASVHEAALAALLTAEPSAKCAAALALRADWRAGRLQACPGEPVRDALREPGRPARPVLVDAGEVPRRNPRSHEGHAALLHAIAHIEFNAIDLALDCVYRFRQLPAEFHAGWVEVAAEEAEHFALVRERLQALGHDYGDFPAHNGLWEMACKTADDPLARMALVPRVLEARGLDATPPIAAKLREIGDQASLAVLDVILRDEIGHVALGDRWFRRLCAERGLAAESTYTALIDAFDAPWPRLPFNDQARLAAGFGEQELAALAEQARERAARRRRAPV